MGEPRYSQIAELSSPVICRTRVREQLQDMIRVYTDEGQVIGTYGWSGTGAQCLRDARLNFFPRWCPWRDEIEMTGAWNFDQRD